MSKNKQTFEYIKEFLTKDGICGFESPLANFYKETAIKNGAQVTRCGLGSVVAKIGNSGPKLLIGSHLDEVGFVVGAIEKEGFIRLRPLGGHWPHAMLGNLVKLVTRNGKEFVGVIGSTSVHVLQPNERTKVMDMNDLFVDFGFDSDEVATKEGVQIGDQLINISEPRLMHGEKKYMAKAIDDRIAVAAQAKVLEILKGQKLNCQLYMAAAVQEEVGSRGGKAVTQMVQPDIAIAIDTTIAHDTPNIIPGNTKLDHGVALQILDGYCISNPIFVNLIDDLAKKHNIKIYRTVAQGGGTDADEFQYSQAGIPTVVLSLPTRYLHTPYEVGSIEDFDSLVNLLVELIKIMDKSTLETMTYK